MVHPCFILAFLFSLGFSLATVIQNVQANSREDESADILKLMMGDSRRMFSDYFFTKADAYFHSGYYPTVFDRARTTEASHMESVSKDEEGHDHEKHEEADFLGKPRDWIEALGRNFFPTSHSHLQNQNEREMLPWLKISAELDPHRVQTYTVAAYWLRTRLGNTKAAEEFLRDGLRANQDSYEILYELGRIYQQDRNDPNRAERLYQLALQKWLQQDSAGKHPDEFVYSEILLALGNLLESRGDIEGAIPYFEKLKVVSPSKDAIEQRIMELRTKISSGKKAP